MECYSAIKRNEIVPFAETWMNPESVIQSEVSQKEKLLSAYHFSRFHMYALVYGICVSLSDLLHSV